MAFIKVIKIILPQSSSFSDQQARSNKEAPKEYSGSKRKHYSEFTFEEHLGERARRFSQDYKRNGEGASNILPSDLPPHFTEDRAKHLLFFFIMEERLRGNKHPRVSNSDVAMELEFDRFGDWSPEVTLDLPEYTSEELVNRAQSPLDSKDVEVADLLLHDLRVSRHCMAVPNTYHRDDKSTTLLKHQVDSICTGDRHGMRVILYNAGRYSFGVLWVFRETRMPEYNNVISLYRYYYSRYIKDWNARKDAGSNLPSLQKDESRGKRPLLRRKSGGRNSHR